MARPAPRVTVLTPTYNRPEYLAEAVRSVVGQDFRNWEMLVINDGGTDVRDVVESFRDPRTAYFSLPENKGKAACLNYGLERAKGQYIAYLDDDDIWYPNHLSALVRALHSNPQVGVAYSDLYAVVFLKGEGGRRYPLEKRICVCRDYNRMLMFHFNHTLHVSLMHQTELALRAGGYDESIRVMVDWDLTRKLSFYTDFLHVQQITGEYYQAICGSDRISDVQRQDQASYQQNLRRIRADLPPEPWPMVESLAVVLPVRRWDGEALTTIQYLVDRLDYPSRIVLVNRDPQKREQDCRGALGALAELKNLHVIPAPAGSSLEDSYLAGISSTEADLYYLPSERLCRGIELRLIKGVCYMAESGCEAVRWAGDRTDGPYDVLLRAGALLSGDRPQGSGHWPREGTVPEGWMPEALKADELLHFAERCQREGDYAAAQALLEEVGALEGGGTGDPYLAQLYARVAFRLGDYQMAEQTCRRLVAEGYGTDNWIRLGRIYQSQGRYRLALDAYERGLAGIGLSEADMEGEAFPFACPVDFDAFHAVAGQGECLLELGLDDQAARALRRAARLRANSARPYIAFGRLFLKHGQLERAAEAFLLAQRQAREAHEAHVEAGLAEVCERRGELEQAYEWCLRGLSRSPANAELLARACRLAQGLGRTKEAVDLYRRFLEYRPGHVPALLGLAEACRQLGRHEEARELGERAALLDAKGGAPSGSDAAGAGDSQAW